MGIIEIFIVLFIGPLLGAALLLVACKLAQALFPQKQSEIEAEEPLAEENFTSADAGDSFDEKNPYAAATATPGQAIRGQAGMPTFFSAWAIAGICSVAFFASCFTMLFVEGLISLGNIGATSTVLVTLGLVAVPYFATIVLKTILLAHFTKRRIGQVVVPIIFDQLFWILLLLPFLGFGLFRTSMN
jgi:hypothetical protein